MRRNILGGRAKRFMSPMPDKQINQLEKLWRHSVMSRDRYVTRANEFTTINSFWLSENSNRATVTGLVIFKTFHYWRKRTSPFAMSTPMKQIKGIGRGSHRGKSIFYLLGKIYPWSLNSRINWEIYQPWAKS